MRKQLIYFNLSEYRSQTMENGIEIQILLGKMNIYSLENLLLIGASVDVSNISNSDHSY